MLPAWFIRRFNRFRDRQYARNVKILMSFILILAIAALVLGREDPVPVGRRLDAVPLTEAQIDGLTLWWFAPFLSGGGYCSEAIDFVKGLRGVLPVKIAHHGDAVSWDFVAGLPLDTQDLLQEAMAREVRREQTVMLCHSEPGAWTPALYETSPCPLGGSQYVIGRTMFETDRIPRGWVERCATIVDEVWVPTEFHVGTFHASGVPLDRLVVMPEPVDTAFWDPDAPDVDPLQLPHRHVDRRESCDAEGRCTPRRRGDPGPCFAFLSVFKWEARKGWDILLRAFLEEFDARKDHVCLYLKTSHFHSDEEFQTTITDFARRELGITPEQWRSTTPGVHVLSRPIPTADMPSLYRSVDCVVIPSRGEGWGRPHVEAMAMGLPVIATNWSGPTAFLTAATGLPLAIDGLETISEGPWRGHQWAKPSVTHLRHLMRWAYTNPAAARALGAAARVDIAARFGIDWVAQLVVQRLAVIKSRLKERARAQLAGDGFTSEHLVRDDDGRLEL